MMKSGSGRLESGLGRAKLAPGKPNPDPSLALPRPHSSLPDVNHAMHVSSFFALIFLLILQSTKLGPPTLTKAGAQTKKATDLGLRAIEKEEKNL